MKLSTLLARPPTSMVKDADVESPDQAQLESDFAGMAFMFLKDRAPALMPYMLGFEVVDREEDGSRAVGIFGCKIGEDYFYIPVFFVNKQIKGMDLLFSKKNNSFVPLRETWINHVLDKSNMSLGENVRNPTGLREDFSVPSFDFVARPPNTPKLASAGLEHLFAKGELSGKRVGKDGITVVDSNKPQTLTTEPKSGKGGKCAADISKDLLATWTYMQDAAKEAMRKDAGFQMAWAGAITAMKGETLELEKAGGSPVFEYLEKHSLAATASLLRTLATNHKFAEAAITFYPDFIDGIKKSGFTQAAKQAAKIKVVSSAKDLPADSTDDERSRLVRDNFSIIDRRADDSKSDLFDQRYEQQFSNPTCGGRFEMLLPTGSTAEAWILPSLQSRSEDSLVVAIHPEKHYFFNASPSRVFVRSGMQDGETAFDAAKDSKNLEVDGRYVLVSKKNEAIGPFRVSSTVSDSSKVVRYNVHFELWKDFSRSTSNSFGSIHGPDFSSEPSTIQFLPNAIKTRRAGDVLYVPESWKALKLESNGHDCCCPYDGSTSDVSKEDDAEMVFEPGDLLNMEEELYKNAVHKLVIESDGVGYAMVLDGAMIGPMPYKQAMVTMVTRMGTGVSAAESLLKEADSEIKSRRMVKFAQGVGVGIQMPIDPGVYGVDDGTGISVQPPFEGYSTGQLLGAGQRQDPLQPGFAVGGQTQREIEGGNSGGGAMGGYAPGGEPLGQGAKISTGQGTPVGQDVGQLAQQAMQSGQKQVFDHSTIGGLAKLYDAGSAIDMYLPDMMKALDRIGRVLFIFYWKNEDFAERYGEEELSTMEDLIRGVFKSFGDLVLKLKEKSVSGSSSKEVMAI